MSAYVFRFFPAQSTRPPRPLATVAFLFAAFPFVCGVSLCKWQDKVSWRQPLEARLLPPRAVHRALGSARLVGHLRTLIRVERRQHARSAGCHLRDHDARRRMGATARPRSARERGGWVHDRYVPTDDGGDPRKPGLEVVSLPPTRSGLAGARPTSRYCGSLCRGCADHRSAHPSGAAA